MKKHFHRRFMVTVIIILSLQVVTFKAKEEHLKIDNHNDFLDMIDNISRVSEIENSGFIIEKEQRYYFNHDKFGEIEAIPSIHKNKRVVLFFADKDENIIYYTENLECNFWRKNELSQLNQSILSLSFDDLNADGKSDIILITLCKNFEGDYVDKTYKVGDVLFQNDNGFYRDWRISDRLNRFDMNKYSEVISAYFKEGISTEYLYKAKTKDELIENGFNEIKYKTYSVNFEKFGVVDVVPGFFTLSVQNFLMIYIIDMEGKILWDLQPMHDYINFYSVQDLSFHDVDGDGLKDISLIAEYVIYDVILKKSEIVKDYVVYYQRIGYFYEDNSARILIINEDEKVEGEDLID